MQRLVYRDTVDGEPLSWPHYHRRRVDMTLVKDTLAAVADQPTCGICALIAKIPADEAVDMTEVMASSSEVNGKQKYLVPHTTVVKVLDKAFRFKITETTVRRCRSLHFPLPSSNA